MVVSRQFRPDVPLGPRQDWRQGQSRNRFGGFIDSKSNVLWCLPPCLYNLVC